MRNRATGRHNQSTPSRKRFRPHMRPARNVYRGRNYVPNLCQILNFEGVGNEWKATEEVC